MFTVLKEKIKIPDSPIVLKIGEEVSEWHISTNTKYQMKPQRIYCQLGGRGIMNGEIVNAGCIMQPSEPQEMLSIENTSFIVVHVN